MFDIDVLRMMINIHIGGSTFDLAKNAVLCTRSCTDYRTTVGIRIFYDILFTARTDLTGS